MNVEYYSMSEDEYAERLKSIWPWCGIAREGEWAVDELGDAPENAERAARILESLPDDTLLSVADCHI